MLCNRGLYWHAFVLITIIYLIKLKQQAVNIPSEIENSKKMYVVIRNAGFSQPIKSANQVSRTQMT